MNLNFKKNKTIFKNSYIARKKHDDVSIKFGSREIVFSSRITGFIAQGNECWEGFHFSFK